MNQNLIDRYFIYSKIFNHIYIYIYIHTYVKEKDNWRDPSVDGRRILSWIFRKWDVGVWTRSSWLRIRTGGGHL
jgi:hypothetical protein